MIDLGKTSPQYLPSSILSKKIRIFYENAAKLLPYLRITTNFIELDTGAQTFAKSFKDLCAAVEPTVLGIRSYADGGAAGTDENQEQIMQSLTQNWGYAEINVNELISLENERSTALSKEFLQSASTGKMIPSESIVRMLRKVIYSGDGRNKFILSHGFPFTTEQSKEFEKSCASIAALIYSAQMKENNIVDIYQGSLSAFDINALFQKEFRLRVMSEWDE